MLFALTTRLLLQATYLALLARALGPAGFGAFAAIVALCSIAGPFVGWGTGHLLVMNVAREPSSFEVHWGNGLLATFLSGTLLGLVVALAAAWVLPQSVPAQTLVMLVLADLWFVRAAELSGQAFQAFERLTVTALLQIGAGVLRVSAVLGFIVGGSHRTLDGWAAWYLGCNFTILVASIAVTSSLLGTPRLQPGVLARQFREGFWFSVGLASRSIYTDIDKIVLARLATLDVVGVYAVASRVVSVALTPISAVLSAAYARFFQEGSRGLGYAVALARRLLWPAATYGLFSAAVLFSLAPLLPRVLGDEFRVSVSAVRWLAVLPLLRSGHHVFADALTGAGYQLHRSLLQLGTAGLNLLLTIWLVAIYSWQGAAAATLFSEGLLTCLMVGLSITLGAREKLAAAGIRD